MSSDIEYVVGPPGCGKTSELSRRAREAAENHGKDAVVIASLTRAAAAEVAGRDTGIPPDAVGTLHAHCYRAMERPPLAETPEGIKAWNAAHPNQAISRGVNQLEDALDGGASEGTAGDDVHHQVMTLRAGMVPRERWTLAQRSHDADWTRWKAETKRADFTDLIERVLAEDRSHPFLPTVLLLDEAQDFSRLELELVRRWAADADTTVLVADPRQALYTWRGADPRALHNLVGDSEPRVLSQSHRVPRIVRSVAESWVSLLSDHRDFLYAPREVDGAIMHSGERLAAGEHVAELVAAKLAESDGTVMVLASCGYMLAPLIRALRDAGLPFHNPYRTNDGRWNPMRGAGRLRAYLAADERVWGEQARCWTWDDLRRWTEPLAAKDSLARGAKALIEAKCTPDRFGETRAHDEAPLETVLELLGVAPGSMRHPALRGDATWWFEHLRATERKAAEYPMQVLKRSGSEALAAEPRVIVGTVHSVKGGEADHVIVAPDLSMQGYWSGWHAGGEGRDSIVRMFYVALTRARETVTLLAPSGAEHVHGELRAACAAGESLGVAA